MPFVLSRCLVLAILQSFACAVFAAEPWKKHIVDEGRHTTNVVAADFTGDGKIDVMANSDGATRLFVGPDWKQRIVDQTQDHDAIHAAVIDVDRDGDPDFIGARYSPGLIFWVETIRGEGASEPWPVHVVDDQVNGIHGLLTGDVDGDGAVDLIANSGQPVGPFANSVVWYDVPQQPREAKAWPRYVAGQGDAPGLSHYLGLGDLNGDGRPDLLTAAKGGPQAEPGTGEWFGWWEAPANPRTHGWKKHLLGTGHAGATNLAPADVNRDGQMDVIATRGHGLGVIWFEGPDWKEHTIHPTLASPHCLALADFDQDGDIDATTCAYESKIAAWFESDGQGQFETHLLDENQCAYDIRAVDMDGDGDLDVLVAGQLSKNVVWYANPLKSKAAPEHR